MFQFLRGNLLKTFSLSISQHSKSIASRNPSPRTKLSTITENIYIFNKRKVVTKERRNEGKKERIVESNLSDSSGPMRKVKMQHSQSTH